MKRYLVFAYEIYYPSGGRNDVIGNHATLEEVQACIKEAKRTYDDYDILDMEKREWVDLPS